MVPRIRKFALQLLPDLTKLLDLPPAFFDFHLGRTLLDNLWQIGQLWIPRSHRQLTRAFRDSSNRV